MYECTIYNNQGEVVDKIEINDDIALVDGRVSKGRTHYYKGIGVPYVGQYTEELDSSFINAVLSDVFYVGYFAQKKQFIGKTGIFQDRYQPQFTDFIGSCGVKELSIIENSMLFEKSSVEVIKSHQYDRENQQYWFELDYKCGRRKFLNNGFNKKLYQLIEYMVQTNWNFVWDKDTITDISYNGLVTDVADIFHSRELSHKLGTIYSVLYSLHYRDRIKFNQFLKDNMLAKHIDQRDFIKNSLLILKRTGVNIDEIRDKPYQDIIMNYLLTGRNCGHCVIDGLGEKIKQKYISNFRGSLNGTSSI